MSLLTTVFIVLLRAPASPAARAQTGEDPCAPEAQRSPQLMARAERQLRQAAAGLKRVRDELHPDLGPCLRVQFRVAERLWPGSRKSNCDAEASIHEGGTIQLLIQRRCLKRVTRARTAALREQLELCGL
jgi:uncharacterized protein YecT (DUF1311 family)